MIAFPLPLGYCLHSRGFKPIMEMLLWESDEKKKILQLMKNIKIWRSPLTACLGADLCPSLLPSEEQRNNPFFCRLQQTWNKPCSWYLTTLGGFLFLSTTGEPSTWKGNPWWPVDDGVCLYVQKNSNRNGPEMVHHLEMCPEAQLESLHPQCPAWTDVKTNKDGVETTNYCTKSRIFLSWKLTWVLYP